MADWTVPFVISQVKFKTSNVTQQPNYISQIKNSLKKKEKGEILRLFAS